MDLLSNQSIYHSVVAQVLNQAKDVLDEQCIDESVLSELKQRWTEKHSKRHPVDYGHYMGSANQPYSTTSTIVPAQQRGNNYNQQQSDQKPLTRRGSNSNDSKSGDAKRGISFQNQSSGNSKRRKTLPGQYDGTVDNEFMDSSSDSDFDKLEEKIEQQNSQSKAEEDSSKVGIEKADETNTNLVEQKEESEDPDCLLDSADDLNLTEEEDEMLDAENFIVCQYDKVSRNKHKWTVQLRNGIVHIKGREYAFCKAQGILEW